MKGRRSKAGDKHGRLTLISEGIRSLSGKKTWVCLCSCGNTKTILQCSIRSGRTKSCGCLRKETCSKNHTTHGKSDSSTYTVRLNMINRCTKPSDKRYSDYGGRGIKVCDRWLESFENFYEDMGDRPEGMTLDRIDNDGDYSPENCRWATCEEQVCNRRNNILVEYQGDITSFPELCRRFGLDYKKAYQRYSTLGWSIDRVIKEGLNV